MEVLVALLVVVSAALLERIGFFSRRVRDDLRKRRR
jgi:hypothetical protein